MAVYTIETHTWRWPRRYVCVCSPTDTDKRRPGHGPKGFCDRFLLMSNSQTDPQLPLPSLAAPRAARKNTTHPRLLGSLEAFHQEHPERLQEKGVGGWGQWQRTVRKALPAVINFHKSVGWYMNYIKALYTECLVRTCA